MTITLPYPPTANLYWRQFRGRMVVSAAARAYKHDAALLALQQGMRPVDGPVSLSLEVYRPRKRGDLDNAIKVLGDSLIGIAYHDDSQVVELHARRHDDKAAPRVLVTVQALAADSDCCATAGRRARFGGGVG